MLSKQYDLKSKHLLHLVGILFPHINDDAPSKSLQTMEGNCSCHEGLHIVGCSAVSTGKHYQLFGGEYCLPFDKR